MNIRLFERPRDKSYLNKSSVSPSTIKNTLANYLDHIEYEWQDTLAKYDIYNTTDKYKDSPFVMDRSAAYATYIRVIALCILAKSIEPINRRHYDRYDLFDLGLGIIAPSIAVPLYILWNILLFIYEASVLLLAVFIPIMHSKKDREDHIERFFDAYAHGLFAGIFSPLLIGIIIALNTLKLIIGVPSAAIATACLGQEEPVEPRFLCRAC